ncbi:MAG TPA: hypothetical protein VNX21_04165 [Candidatus Thermoplasmatota archaeon]|nr:hypothetical protein [Candidatus Thermoplasmatota archaeon]
MRTLLAVAAALAFGLGLPAHAAHCDADFYALCPDQPPCLVYEVTDGSAEGTSYLHHREGWAPGTYLLYEETNGAWTPKPAGAYASLLGREAVAHDLQRGGCSETFPRDCDWIRDCPDLPPDRLLL